MNIQARILARKILFCYFFEQYFLTLSGEKDAVSKEMNLIAHHMHDDDGEARDLQTMMSADYYANSDEEIAYIVKRFFSREDEEKTTDPDRGYLKIMAPQLWVYEKKVEALVNSFATTFQFAQMDAIDRVIFILGYAEYKEIGTPKQVVINEMIEFGKRYGDESSGKLINGIAHQLFAQEELSN